MVLLPNRLFAVGACGLFSLGNSAAVQSKGPNQRADGTAGGCQWYQVETLSCTNRTTTGPMQLGLYNGTSATIPAHLDWCNQCRAVQPDQHNQSTTRPVNIFTPDEHNQVCLHWSSCTGMAAPVWLHLCSYSGLVLLVLFDWPGFLV